MCKKLIKISTIIFLCLTLINFGYINKKGYATIDNYGTITLTSEFQSGNFSKIYDLTKYDMLISCTFDGTGLIDDSGCHAWAEIGIRAEGYSNFNPTWLSEGAGIWIATDYDWTNNTFDPDPFSPTLDLDDKIILQKGGGWGEGSYNLPSTPPEPGTNYGIWFDRDGVNPYQATNWGSIDGCTYNTNGRYKIHLYIHATSSSAGQAYLKINNVSQGFYVGGWKNAQPEIYPAGMTFTGNMTQMQVFYGLYGYGAIHTIKFENIQVILNDEVWVDDDWAGSIPGQEVAPGKIFGFNAFAKIQDGINAVAVGGTVHVAAGTYTENIKIIKSLNLIGSGRDNTVIRNAQTGTQVYTLNIDGNEGPLTGDVYIEGFTFKDNFGPTDWRPIIASDHIPSGITLRFRNNKIDNGYLYGWYDYHSHGNFDFNNNIISNVEYGMMLEGWDNGTINIIENEFYCKAGYFGYPAAMFMFTYDNVNCNNLYNIKGNLINLSNPGYGIVFYGGYPGHSPAFYSNIIIEQNIIDSSGLYGIYFRNLAPTGQEVNGGIKGALIKNNFITRWDKGIYILGQNSNIDISYNYIYGNDIGIENTGSDIINAENNWWGDESGPSGVGSGTGDAVSANVDYSPWLVPNISVTKSDSPDPVAQGMPLTYTLNWTMGSTWATWDGTTIGNTTVNIPSGLIFGNVSLKDALPPEVTYVSCTDGGTHSLGVITWNLGTYIPGTSGSITVNVNVNLDTPDGTITNNIEIIYDSLKRLDTETTTVQKGAQSVYSFYDSRSNAYVMIDLSVPRWRVTIPSKGYDTGWKPFRRYTRTNNHFWGEYADTRYHLIIDFYSSGRYHIIFDDRVTRISIKIAN